MGVDSRSVNAPCGQLTTHLAQRIHFLFGLPCFIACCVHTALHFPQPSHRSLRTILTPIRLRPDGANAANGFLRDRGIVTAQELLSALNILSVSGASSSNLSNPASSTYACFVGMYAAAIILWL